MQTAIQEKPRSRRSRRTRDYERAQARLIRLIRDSAIARDPKHVAAS